MSARDKAAIDRVEVAGSVQEPDAANTPPAQADCATLPVDFYEAPSAKKPPSGWPTVVLLSWAWWVLPQVVSSVEAGNLPMQTTFWPDLYATTGELQTWTWDALAWWLLGTRDLRVGAKNQVPLWSPGRFDGDKRLDDAAQALYALVLDCDDCGDWVALLAALDSVGLAYVAHRSPSHGVQATDGASTVVKWRLVIPLARPVEGNDLAHWRAAYATARLLFGAIGHCWFDPTTPNPSRFWFAASAVGEAQPRELIWPLAGRTLDLGRLLALAPAPPPRAPHAQLPRRADGDPIERGRRYLAAAGPAVTGSRNTTAFRLGVWLVTELGLGDAEVWSLLGDWNDSNPDPLPAWELQACLRSALRTSTRALAAQD